MSTRTLLQQRIYDKKLLQQRIYNEKVKLAKKKLIEAEGVQWGMTFTPEQLERIYQMADVMPDDAVDMRSLRWTLMDEIDYGEYAAAWRDPRDIYHAIDARAVLRELVAAQARGEL